jgi:hypothetical protein
MDSSSVPETPAGAGESPQPQAAESPIPPEAAPAPLPSEPPVQPPDVLPPSKVTGEFNVLCYTLLSLFVVSFSVWLIFSWTGYGKRYAPHADGWYMGGTRTVEVTLIREDAHNLSCASDLMLEDLHCGYRANQQPFDPNGTEDRLQLRPYNTADSVLFLGAGLWSSPGLAGPLPKERFTVICNFRMISAIKSVSLRWSPTGSFGPVKDAVPAGLLSDCVIPQ